MGIITEVAGWRVVLRYNLQFWTWPQSPSGSVTAATSTSHTPTSFTTSPASASRTCSSGWGQVCQPYLSLPAYIWLKTQPRQIMIGQQATENPLQLNLSAPHIRLPLGRATPKQWPAHCGPQERRMCTGGCRRLVPMSSASHQSSVRYELYP